MMIKLTKAEVEEACEHCQAPQVCDHINGNALDNRRSNLRITDFSGNSCNVGLKKNNTTGFKGIKNCQNKRWEAALKHNGKTIYLGSFRTAENAAQAYNFSAIEYFGDMAKTNAAGVKYHED